MDQGGQRPSSQSDSKAPSQEDMEKFKKKMDKQEQSLQKTMRKILGDDATYNRWLQIRQTQIPGAPKK
jgi:hypothetical protein